MVPETAKSKCPTATRRRVLNFTDIEKIKIWFYSREPAFRLDQFLERPSNLHVFTLEIMRYCIFDLLADTTYNREQTQQKKNHIIS